MNWMFSSGFTLEETKTGKPDILPKGMALSQNNVDK